MKDRLEGDDGGKVKATKKPTDYKEKPANRLLGQLSRCKSKEMCQAATKQRNNSQDRRQVDAQQGDNYMNKNHERS